MKEIKTPNEKVKRCRYAFPDWDKAMENPDAYKCYKKDTNGNPVETIHFLHQNDDEVMDITSETCENCPYFHSKFIEYPIEVNEIDTEDWKSIWNSDDKKVGSFVKIRHCTDEYENKTFLGIYMGELPYAPSVRYNEKEKGLKVGARTNPCIFVPDLNKFIWGMESWWGIIKSPDDLKDISDQDIENVWYVQLLKSMTTKGEEK